MHDGLDLEHVREFLSQIIFDNQKAPTIQKAYRDLDFAKRNMQSAQALQGAKYLLEKMGWKAFSNDDYPSSYEDIFVKKPFVGNQQEFEEFKMKKKQSDREPGG